MDIGKKKVSFPMVANYNSVVRYFVECGLDAQFIMPPKMTRRTLEIGSRYSPDYVCAPFKSTLGSMIDALEAGADTLVMTMGYAAWVITANFRNRLSVISAIILR